MGECSTLLVSLVYLNIECSVLYSEVLLYSPAPYCIVICSIRERATPLSTNFSGLGLVQLGKKKRAGSRLYTVVLYLQQNCGGAGVEVEGGTYPHTSCDTSDTSDTSDC